MAAEHALGISGRHVWALTGLISIYGGWNKPESARLLYDELQERSARDYVQPSMFAIAASAVDEVEIAIQLAQQAVDEKDPLFVMIARSWPQYRRLRTDPLFIQIVSQLRLPNWEK